MPDTEQMIPLIMSDSTLNSYYCPYCRQLLFKGNIKKINMACHHCQRFIAADESDLETYTTE